MIKEQEAGMPTAELCRRHGLSSATFYKLNARCGGMNISDAQKLKVLEDAFSLWSDYAAAEMTA